MDIAYWLIAVEHVIVVCSVLHMLLPPYETFDEFPRFRQYYKLIVLIVGNISLNKRESVVGLYQRVKAANGEKKDG